MLTDKNALFHYVPAEGVPEVDAMKIVRALSILRNAMETVSISKAHGVVGVRVPHNRGKFGNIKRVYEIEDSE